MFANKQSFLSALGTNQRWFSNRSKPTDKPATNGSLWKNFKGGETVILLDVNGTKLAIQSW